MSTFEIIKHHAEIASDKDMKDKIIKQGMGTASYKTKIIIRRRSSVMDNMERLLMMWIEDCN